MTKLNLHKKALFFISQNKKCTAFNLVSKRKIVGGEILANVLALCNGSNTKNAILDKFDIGLRLSVESAIDTLAEMQIIEYKAFENEGITYEEVSKFYLSLTQNCNLHCDFCINGRSTNAFTKELSVNRWIEIVEAISKFNSKEKTVYLTGGEPLMHHGFESIYKYLVKQNIKVNIFTNGTLIKKGTIDLFAIYPPNAILISVDGSKSETHDKMRGMDGAFNAIQENIKNLIDRGNQTKVLWQCVVDERNFHDVENIINLAVEYGVTSVRFGVVSEIGNGKNSNALLDENKLMQLYKNLSILKQRYRAYITINRSIEDIDVSTGSYSCGIGEMIHISSDGFATPCYGLNGDKYKRGPIRDVSSLHNAGIAELYNYNHVTRNRICRQIEYQVK